MVPLRTYGVEIETTPEVGDALESAGLVSGYTFTGHGAEGESSCPKCGTFYRYDPSAPRGGVICCDGHFLARAAREA